MTRQQSIQPDICSSVIGFLNFTDENDVKVIYSQEELAQNAVISNFLITANDCKNNTGMTKVHKLSEFVLYRLIQDRYYQSGFDRTVKQ